MKALVAMIAAALILGASAPVYAKVCFKDGKTVCSGDKDGDQRPGWENHKKK